MQVKSITRKQAGVIYSNVKRGTIKMSKQAVSAMYDMVGEVFIGSQSMADYYGEQIAALRLAIDAIFDGNIEWAQDNINAFSQLVEA